MFLIALQTGSKYREAATATEGENQVLRKNATLLGHSVALGKDRDQTLVIFISVRNQGESRDPRCESLTDTKPKGMPPFILPALTLKFISCSLQQVTQFTSRSNSATRLPAERTTRAMGTSSVEAFPRRQREGRSKYVSIGLRQMGWDSKMDLGWSDMQTLSWQKKGLKGPPGHKVPSTCIQEVLCAPHNLWRPPECC